MNSNEENALSDTAAIEDNKKQGRRIADLRKLTGMNRQTFCEKYHIATGTMQNLELGRYQGITRNIMETLILAFKNEGIPCTTDYILFGKNEISTEALKSASNLIEQAQQQSKRIESNRLFFNAIKSGQNDLVHEFIKHDPRINLKSDSVEFKPYSYIQNSPLHEAARKGHLNVAITLLKERCNVNAKNKFHETPLHIATKHGYEEIVRNLILNDADINAKDRDGDTPLGLACYFGQRSIAKQLIKSKADLNTGNLEGYTPMHWAACSGYQDIIRLLLEYNAKYSEKNLSGETPLMCAVKNGHVAAVEELERQMA